MSGLLGLGGLGGLIRIKQRALALFLEIVELAVAECESEQTDDAQHHQHRQGNEQVKAVHGRLDQVRCRRIELPTTSNELVAMPRPAAQGGNAPASASGTQMAL